MHQSYYMYLGTVYHILRDNGKRIKLIRFHNTVFNMVLDTTLFTN